MDVLQLGFGLLLLVLLLLLTAKYFHRAAQDDGGQTPETSSWQHLCHFFSGQSTLSLPGPPARFIIGNMLEMTHEHLPRHLTNLARRYGDIYQLRCGNTNLVVLSSAEVIKEALVKKWSDFAGRPISYTGDIVSGGGRSISLGDYNKEWRAHRRLVHSALQRSCQQSLHQVIETQAAHLRKVLEDYQGHSVDLSEDFTVAASNVITTLAFGKQYDKSSSELQQLHSCLNEIVDLWGSSWISALDLFPLLRKCPNPVFARLLREVARRDQIIAKHLSCYKADQKKCEDTITNYFLQGLDKLQSAQTDVVIVRLGQLENVIFTGVCFPSAADPHTRSHGHRGPSDRGYRDDGGLAQLDGSLHPAQTRGADHGVRRAPLRLGGALPQIQRETQASCPEGPHQRGAASEARRPAGCSAPSHQRQQVGCKITPAFPTIQPAMDHISHYRNWIDLNQTSFNRITPVLILVLQVISSPETQSSSQIYSERTMTRRLGTTHTVLNQVKLKVRAEGLDFVFFPSTRLCFRTFSGGRRRLGPLSGPVRWGGSTLPGGDRRQNGALSVHCPPAERLPVRPRGGGRAARPDRSGHCSAQNPALPCPSAPETRGLLKPTMT
ncbi:uncharacterized protein LOC128771744 isoform X2 [Synchiropus splendidus]|uniref:uncharacterized protein LOC128771744 isoform X2 n=1 Tax=Synchiropus splendidus TaxID=270530 RepID=UPI00237E68B9|nr:uncharacterized protein LOC128771744 isoform X2 [Synchiropus splendidus]